MKKNIINTHLGRTKKMLKISFEKAQAKATGREYEYVSISIDNVEITRIFIRQTERTYYESLIGDYQKEDE